MLNLQYQRTNCIIKIEEFFKILLPLETKVVLFLINNNPKNIKCFLQHEILLKFFSL